ncbi:hypothetical protein Pmani_039519 [Petrolisthes manimaculis]|uniref:Uncharacterized protein n=1 Tax=Petrolisthes manimaculis TaxID=1843537 RepID=A0AAE1NE00_9EUCA|nr:hypothetical protein Pmani_039519 [Petrolisthes manimaculis]
MRPNSSGEPQELRNPLAPNHAASLRHFSSGPFIKETKRTIPTPAPCPAPPPHSSKGSRAPQWWWDEGIKVGRSWRAFRSALETGNPEPTSPLHHQGAAGHRGVPPRHPDSYLCMLLPLCRLAIHISVAILPFCHHPAIHTLRDVSVNLQSILNHLMLYRCLATLPFRPPP